jgi:putative NADH-flavin reductase
MVRVAVIGPSGFGGSAITIELIDRGHDVIGISRNPDKLGKHDKYTPYVLDVGSASIAELVKAYANVDVVINTYNPPYAPNVYSKSDRQPSPHCIMLSTATQEHTSRRSVASSSLQKPPSTSPTSST